MRMKNIKLSRVAQTSGLPRVAQTSSLPVAQTSSLPYRGFPIRRCNQAGTACRLEVGDTAGWKPALRVRPAHSGGFRIPHSALRTSPGFTMIEIAISLGIIAFALVAVIGILPFGMGVQRENREETIINQDTSMLLDAIRNGDQGLDDLANYVLGITNTQTWYPATGRPTAPIVYKYTKFNSWTFSINPGAVIVGLLSTPKYVPVYQSSKQGQLPMFMGFYSNHVVATIRSMSGTASDKPPQNNPSVADMAFTYRVICEVVPYGTGNWQAPYNFAWDPNPNWTNNGASVPLLRYANNLQADLYDLRLLFRWPALPNGALGSGRQAVRAVTAGPVAPLPPPPYFNPQYTLYFVQPKTFVRAQ